MFTDKWLKPSSVMMLDNFLKLPRRAQELLFCYLTCNASERSAHFLYVNWIGNNEITSPIEQIYYLADQILYYENDVSLFDMPIPQYEIKCSNKRYKTDFFYTNEESKILAEEQGFQYPYSDIRVIVECDGHDFHEKTKQQVKKDNERQMALQLAGYDVIHFSGSQVYENPMKCVKEVHDYIRMKLGIPAESNSRS